MSSTEPLLTVAELARLKRNSAVVVHLDGSVTRHIGKLEGDALRELIGCTYVQMVPCTVAPLSPKIEIWVDEEGGIKPDNLNGLATAKLGSQVCGGQLHGTVVVVRSGTVP